MEDSTVWSWSIISDGGKPKTIRLVHGDLCDRQEECDVVVCSAFKRDYIPTRTSLIGGLWHRHGISVDALAANPALDLRNRGCWLSRETDTHFHRIACVELLEYGDDPRDEAVIEHVLRHSFSTLNYVLEQAALDGIALDTVALPILGTGDQGIDTAFMMITMIAQCRMILKYNEAVQTIVIYERDRERALLAAGMMDEAFSITDVPQVFFSYSSKQYPLAKAIYDVLCEHQISCWMAPESIPIGEDYTEAIPVALNRVEAVFLLLTPEAQQSRWVRKEISTAIGADKIVLPYQPFDFPLEEKFRFILEGEQIEKQSPDSGQNAYHRLADLIKQKLAVKRV